MEWIAGASPAEANISSVREKASARAGGSSPAMTVSIALSTKSSFRRKPESSRRADARQEKLDPGFRQGDR
jgi:hypothetical protein